MSSSTTTTPLYDPLICSIAVYDDTLVWNHVEKHFKKHLPLKNPSWRNNTTGSYISVPKLPIQCIPYDHKFFNNTTSSEWYRAPYMHMYMVMCESMDVYKTSLKDKIKMWVTEKEHQQYEWLIVYVPMGTRASKDAYDKIFQKLCQDFNPKQWHDRVSMLAMFDQGKQQDQEHWNLLLSNMKACIVSTFQDRIKMYDEEVRRLDQTRVHENWDFFKFFGIKEGMALMFEQMQLPTDALVKYSELEAYCDKYLYQQISHGSFDGEWWCLGDDGNSSIFEFDVIHFRGKIARRAVGRFEMQQYLMARECSLLLKTKSHEEIAYRCNTFVETYSRILYKIANQLGITNEIIQFWGFRASSILADFLIEQITTCYVKEEFQIIDYYSSNKNDNDRDNKNDNDKLPIKPVKPPKPPTPSNITPKQNNNNNNNNANNTNKDDVLLQVIVDQENSKAVLSCQHISTLLAFSRKCFLKIAEYVLGDEKFHKSCVYIVQSGKFRDNVLSWLPKVGLPADDHDSFHDKDNSMMIQNNVNNNNNNNNEDDTEEEEIDFSNLHLFVREILVNNSWLSRALSSAENFDQEYLKLIIKESLFLKNGHRHRISNYSLVEQGHILFLKGRYDDAAHIFEKQIDEYFSERWNSISCYLLRLLARYAKINDNCIEYLNNLLYMISMLGIRDDASFLDNDKNEIIIFINEIDYLVHNKINEKLVRSGEILFNCKVIPNDNNNNIFQQEPNKFKVGDEISFQISLNSILPTNMKVDKIYINVIDFNQCLSEDRISTDFCWTRKGMRRITGYDHNDDNNVNRYAKKTGPFVFNKDQSVYQNYQIVNKIVWNATKETKNGPYELLPGNNDLFFKSEKQLQPGTYVLETLFIEIGNLILVYPMLEVQMHSTYDFIKEMNLLATIKLPNILPIDNRRNLKRGDDKLFYHTSQHLSPTYNTLNSSLYRAQVFLVYASPPHLVMDIISCPLLSPLETRQQNISVCLNTKRDHISEGVLLINLSPKSLTLNNKVICKIVKNSDENDNIDEALPITSKCEISELECSLTESDHASSRTAAKIQIPDIEPWTEVELVIPIQPVSNISEDFHKEPQEKLIEVDFQVEINAIFNSALFNHSYFTEEIILEQDNNEKKIHPLRASVIQSSMIRMQHPFRIDMRVRKPQESSHLLFLRSTLSNFAEEKIQTDKKLLFFEIIVTNISPSSITFHGCELIGIPHSHKVINNQNDAIWGKTALPSQEFNFSFMIVRTFDPDSDFKPNGEMESQPKLSLSYTWGDGCCEYMIDECISPTSKYMQQQLKGNNNNNNNNSNHENLQMNIFEKRIDSFLPEGTFDFNGNDGLRLPSIYFSPDFQTMDDNESNVDITKEDIKNLLKNDILKQGDNKHNDSVIDILKICTDAVHRFYDKPYNQNNSVATIGTPFSIDILISCYQSINDEDIKYEIDYSTNDWLIFGFTKGLLSFGDQEVADSLGFSKFVHLQLKVLPVRLGYVPSPILRLYRARKLNINNQNLLNEIEIKNIYDKFDAELVGPKYIRVLPVRDFKQPCKLMKI